MGSMRRRAWVLLLALPAGCAHHYTPWEPEREELVAILGVMLESEPGAVGTPADAGSPGARAEASPGEGPGALPEEAAQLAEKGYRPYETLRKLAQDTLQEDFDALEDAVGEPSDGKAEILRKVRRIIERSGRLPVYEMLKPKAVPPSWVAAARGDSAGGRGRLPESGRGPIRSAELCRALVQGAGEANARQLELLYGEEFREIDAAKAGSPHAKRIGLALSGGGVRSASFSVGVLQGLYELGLLEEVGYLSTVSGGAYAASWYMLHPESDDALLRRGSTHLRHLSQNGYFLVSAHSSDYKTEIATKIALHTLAVPGHWLFNGVLDLELNWPFLRGYYESGLARTYQYRNPLSLEEKEQRKFASIREVSPRRHAELGCQRPLWIVNMHVAFNDDRGGARSRNGDAFELTPLRAGSDTTGYVRVPDGELPSNHFWMRPRTAVAISGAALDSQGAPQSLLLNYLGQAFNLDLGYYVQSWDDDWIAGSTQGGGIVGLRNLAYYAASPFPVYGLLSPLVSLLNRRWHLGQPWHERTQHGKYYRLTDGGHFDNLGIYALVRRGCRLIIVSDATAEAEINDWGALTNKERGERFGDFREVERKLVEDFGVEVTMEWDNFQRVPVFEERFSDHPPFQAFTGTIRSLPILADGKVVDSGDVKLVYIRAAYDFRWLRNTDGFIDAQKSSTPEFPNDATARQFFHERRVSAYRALARAMVMQSRGALKEAFQSVRTAYR